ncbi:MAG TPA: MBL fold metallo-hydrolase [Herpetosiphonaceae bacterium]|nr:MBL fold metallo-hydrolase [Herpetosiphonaceae bacterium]
MKQIAPAVWTFSGLLVGRVYAIKDADGLTLIDSGLESAPAKIMRQLRDAGYQPGDVKRILLTHAHVDHASGLRELYERTGAEISVPAGERDFVEGRRAPVKAPDEALTAMERRIFADVPFLKSAPVHRTLSDGDVLPEVMGGLQALGTPGHSPDHMAYWHPGRRILFCGDVMMRLPSLSLPFRTFTVDMEQNKRSIARVAGLGVDLLCLGHGQPLANAAPAINQFARKVGALGQESVARSQ